MSFFKSVMNAVVLTEIAAEMTYTKVKNSKAVEKAIEASKATMAASKELIAEHAEMKAKVKEEIKEAKEMLKHQREVDAFIRKMAEKDPAYQVLLRK